MTLRKALAVLGFTLGLLGWASAVQAACSTHTYIIDGRVIFCTTCCYGGICNTTCT